MVNTVGSLRQTHKISSRESAIIIGTILGDAHIALTKTSARLEIIHSENQRSYLNWKYNELRNFIGAKPHRVVIKDARYQREYAQWRFKSLNHYYFAQLHRLFYPKGRKVVPKDISRWLNSPLGSAVWFMDDGGRRNDSYGLFLNTLSFSKFENETLRKCLRTNFSFESRIHWISDGYRLYVLSSSVVKFCNLVSPYIINSMRYKLPYDPVTTSFARLDRARDRKIKQS